MMSGIGSLLSDAFRKMPCCERPLSEGKHVSMKRLEEQRCFFDFQYCFCPFCGSRPVVHDNTNKPYHEPNFMPYPCLP
jgi:hypothetical protein